MYCRIKKESLGTPALGILAKTSTQEQLKAVYDYKRENKGKCST